LADLLAAETARPDRPEAEPGQEHCGGEEDPGFVPLEDPEAAGGLVGDHGPEVEGAQRVVACLGVFPWQALTLLTVNGGSAGSVFWVEMIQLPVMPGRLGTRMVLPPGPTGASALGMVGAVSATSLWAGGMRGGRTQMGHAIWMDTKAARGAAMAGTGGRVRPPAPTPSAEARA